MKVKVNIFHTISLFQNGQVVKSNPRFKFIHSYIKEGLLKVNPSTPRPDPSTVLRTSGQGLLRVDPERRFLSPPSKAGLGAVEWVN
jgi:hypothetical protein